MDPPRETYWNSMARNIGAAARKSLAGSSQSSKAGPDHYFEWLICVPESAAPKVEKFTLGLTAIVETRWRKSQSRAVKSLQAHIVTAIPLPREPSTANPPLEGCVNVRHLLAQLPQNNSNAAASQSVDS
jgi:hypothetical protein